MQVQFRWRSRPLSTGRTPTPTVRRLDCGGRDSLRSTSPPYIADACALELSLLAGGTGREVEGHDRGCLLEQWLALPRDTQIVAWVALVMRVIMAFALLWAAGALVIDRLMLEDETGDDNSGRRPHERGET
jgi:hypothetical protein